MQALKDEKELVAISAIEPDAIIGDLENDCVLLFAAADRDARLRDTVRVLDGVVDQVEPNLANQRCIASSISSDGCFTA